MNGKAGRSAVEPPDVFHRRLSAGIEDGSIAFTNKGDVNLVAQIYERAFLAELSSAVKLHYNNLGWGCEEARILAATLIYAHERDALRHLRFLSLRNNSIGDLGCAALTEVLLTGVAPNLQYGFVSFGWNDFKQCANFIGMLQGNSVSRSAKAALRKACKSKSIMAPKAAFAVTSYPLPTLILRAGPISSVLRTN